MLETSRLKLVPLTHEFLLLYKSNPPELATILGVRHMHMQNDPIVEADHEEALTFWIEKTLAFRERFEWFTNWSIILKEENVAIGGIGYAGFPNEEGKTTVGYGLDMRYHNSGFATEALRALLAWGFSHVELDSVMADTLVYRIPSQKVLTKNGFLETSRDSELIHWRKNR